MPTDDLKPNRRSNRQNKALHTYLTLIARELENQGQTMNGVVKLLGTIEIPPTKESVKTIIWKPIQNTLYSKKSTTELTTAEVTKVYEVMSQFLANQFQISIPFPSEEDSEEYLQSLDK